MQGAPLRTQSMKCWISATKMFRPPTLPQGLTLTNPPFISVNSSTSGSSFAPDLVPNSSMVPVSFLMLRLKLASICSVSPLSKRMSAEAKSSTSYLKSRPFEEETQPFSLLARSQPRLL